MHRLAECRMSSVVAKQVALILALLFLRLGLVAFFCIDSIRLRGKRCSSAKEEEGKLPARLWRSSE